MAKSPDKHTEGLGGEKVNHGGRRGDGPRIVAPGNRMNIAFPFSQIKLQEPTKELSDLAGVILDLISAMAEWIPEERLAELRGRAQAVYDNLR